MPQRPKPGSKTDREALRSEMAASGAAPTAIAIELRARFGLRPREAWRHAHGWTLQETADRFNTLAALRSDGPAADASLVGKWEKWPAASGRRVTLPVLTVLADLYGCTLDDLLDLEDRRALPDSDLRVLARHVPPRAAEEPAQPRATSSTLAGGDLVRLAADESAQWAQWAEASNIGDIALEQILADTRSLATDYLMSDPLPLFVRTRVLRDRVFALLEGHQAPSQTRDLYVAAGYLCALLAWMSSDLGHLADADTHGRTGWLCAELADHPGLRAWVSSTRSKIAFWDGRLRDAVNHARRGASYKPPGTAQVLLACQEADAWAELGQAEPAQAALHRAAEARERAGGFDDIGALFSCGPARHANYSSSVHVRTGATRQALAEADLGLDELARQPVRAYGTEAQLHINRANAYLMSGDPDGAVAAVTPVLALPPDQRLDPVTQRLRQLGLMLSRSRLGDSQTGLHLQGAVEVFCREASSRPLALSPSSVDPAWISGHD